ncbi:hypothetical protein AAC387_Pa10g1187 [Persea americana]
MQSASCLSYSCADSFCDFYTCVASALLLQFLGTLSHGLIRKFQGVCCCFSLGENPMKRANPTRESFQLFDSLLPFSCL